MNKGRDWLSLNPDHSAELWGKAAELNATNALRGEWVPKEAIHIPEWAARKVDPDTVSTYAQHPAELPPIRVQAKTFILIDGRHRFEAEPSDFIRIEEDPIPDDMLFAESVRANTTHGRVYTPAERMANLKVFLKDFVDSGTGKYIGEWTDARIAQYVGVSRMTVWNHRALADAASKGGEARPQVVNIIQPNPVRTSPQVQRPVVSSFTPDSDEYPEEPDDDDEDDLLDEATGELRSKGGWGEPMPESSSPVSRQDGPPVQPDRPVGAADYLTDFQIKRLVEAIELLNHAGVPARRYVESMGPSLRHTTKANLRGAIRFLDDIGAAVGVTA